VVVVVVVVVIVVVVVVAVQQTVLPVVSSVTLVFVFSIFRNSKLVCFS
jgi:hypothetical protein